MLARVPAFERDRVARDFRAARREVDAGIVESTSAERRKYWAHWARYARNLGLCPYLGADAVPWDARVRALTGFASRVRTGYYGRGSTVGVQTVQVALRAIGKTCELERGVNPTYRAPGQYITQLEMQVEGFRRGDPIPVPELAVPVAVAEWFAAKARDATSAEVAATGDLGVVAFFYLLRVGEYTSSCTRGLRRTKQFRVRDVSFHRHGRIIDPAGDLEALLSATGATLKLTNQKNGVRGSCVHHHAISNTDVCPVRALARRVHHVRSNGGTGDDMLCTFFDHRGKGVVKDRDVTRMVRVAAVDLKLAERGFPPHRVGSHSLRAGGAVALAVNGASRDMIKKIGRWSSDTFLMYIHEQISHLTVGVAERMATPFPFTNIEGATTSGDHGNR